MRAVAEDRYQPVVPSQTQEARRTDLSDPLACHPPVRPPAGPRAPRRCGAQSAAHDTGPGALRARVRDARRVLPAPPAGRAASDRARDPPLRGSAREPATGPGRRAPEHAPTPLDSTRT